MPATDIAVRRVGEYRSRMSKGAFAAVWVRFQQEPPGAWSTSSPRTGGGGRAGARLLPDGRRRDRVVGRLDPMIVVPPSFFDARFRSRRDGGYGGKVRHAFGGLREGPDAELAVASTRRTVRRAGRQPLDRHRRPRRSRRPDQTPTSTRAYPPCLALTWARPSPLSPHLHRSCSPDCAHWSPDDDQ